MSFVRVPGNPEPDGAEELWLEGRGGLKIRALWAPAPKRPARGSVILCNGRTEFVEKYFEVIRELQQRNFAVYTIDWRGQGLSDRLIKKRLAGHIDTMDEAVADLAQGVKNMGEGKLPRPYIMLAHSMGGNIGLRALQTRRLEVEGAIFSAPMWGIAGLKPAARNFARFMTAIGAGGMIGPGQPGKWRKEKFKRNPVTHDRERHARAQALIMAEPQLALAGVTYGWVTAAANTIEGFRQPGALAHLRIPITVLTAAEDELVDNDSHDIVSRLLPQARHDVIQRSRHEIMMERDEIRTQFWRAFDALADKVAPAKGG
jgi:lysophospholipase